MVCGRGRGSARTPIESAVPPLQSAIPSLKKNIRFLTAVDNKAYPKSSSAWNYYGIETFKVSPTGNLPENGVYMS